MAKLNKKELIAAYNKRQSLLVSESVEKGVSSAVLKRYSSEFSIDTHYDIFLSHSYDDARIIKQIRDMLTEKGHSVYVDWIEDGHLNRNDVSEETASVLRYRMNNCSSLIYITSQAAEKSLWMPWELGYMDARTGRVAVAPIADDDDPFDGREYLGLYPYLDLTYDLFFIQRDKLWVTLSSWLKGHNPKPH